MQHILEIVVQVVKIEEEISHGASESGEEGAKAEPGCQLHKVYTHSLVELFILGTYIISSRICYKLTALCLSVTTGLGPISSI